MAKFKIKGLKELQRELTKMERNIPKEVEKEIGVIAQEILNIAVSRVHVLSGDLKASAFIERIDGGYTIGFSAKYAAYEEFGTGPLTEVPRGYEPFAMEFFVSGKGMKQAHPFLFPPFLARKNSIANELEVALTAYLKQF